MQDAPIGEQHNIVSESHAWRQVPEAELPAVNPWAGTILPGLRLIMRNGEIWFHPYTGNRGAPWRLFGDEKQAKFLEGGN